MNKRVRTITIFILSAMLVLTMVPCAAFGSQEEAGADTQAQDSSPDRTYRPGIRNIDLDIYNVPGAGQESGQNQIFASDDQVFPDSYDPRQEPWFAANIRIGNQGDSSLCWAFAATTAAQMSYAKELYQRDPSVVPSVPGMSPTQLGYFFYHRIDDPLGNTTYDKNNYPEPWYDVGGAIVETMQHMATWSGLMAAWESQTDYTEAGLKNIKFTADQAYGQNQLVQEEGIIYDRVPYTQPGLNKVKKMITDYGGVMAAIDYTKYWYLYNKVNFYNCRGTKPNHAITIIGWDDGYDRNNFSSLSSSTARVQPQSDGAWLCMNSWGESENDKGYFYVSYESMEILRYGLLAFDMQPAEANIDNYQYDGNAHYNYVKMLSGKAAANVFTARQDSQIAVRDVAFTVFNNGMTSYDIEVYTGLTDPKDPTSGSLAMTDTVSTSCPGVHSFPLPEEVLVDAGESFSVVIRLGQTAYMGIETDDYDAKSRYYYAKAGLDPAQSFYYDPAGKTWNDVYNEDFCFRIKAFAYNDAVCIHDYDRTEGQVVKPTKSRQGYTIYRCSRCGHGTAEDFTPMLPANPNKIKLTKLKKARKAITVKWNKSGEIIRGKHITGYQIRSSLKKSMKKAKKVRVTGWTKTSKKIKKLKAKKRYYVQIRAYTTVNGKNYYSPWSNKKSVKTQ